MARRRFFVDAVHNHQAELIGDDARHLTHVLRVEKGQRYEISDNQEVYLAEVEMARKDRVVFRTVEKLAANEPVIDITLLLSLIKFDHLELILEKATELGVARIVIIDAARTEKGLDRAVDKRMARWRRIVRESSQQSRRVHLPEIVGPMQAAEAFDTTATRKLFLDEARTGTPLLVALSDPSPHDTIAIAIGPEGGWTDAERDDASRHGWLPVSLGPQILRTDTAAIAALAITGAAYLASNTIKTNEPCNT